MKENMPFGLKIAIINRAFKKRLDEKASAIWCSRFVPLALLSFLNYCLQCSIFVDNSALLC